MGNHARLSASGSAMWMNCPGSIFAKENFLEQHPDFDDSSEFAMEGTAAHQLAEKCLTRKHDASQYLNTTEYVEPGGKDDELVPFEVTQEMVDAVQEYLDTVRAVKGKLYVEVKLDVSPWIPKGFGTADAVVVTDEGAIHIFDLKYGKGVKVYAENNTQALIYALGVFNEFEFIHSIETYVMVIVQPRMDHIDEARVSVDKLGDFGIELVCAAEKAEAEDAPRIPSEKACQWCIAKPTCTELREHVVKHAMSGFELVNAGGAEDDEDLQVLADTLTELPLITKWIKAVSGYAEEELKSGVSIPGFKLVAGKSSRSWKDEALVEKKLRNVKKITVADCFVKKLKSPAQVEKMLGKTHAIVQEQVVWKTGKVTIAPISDKRPAVNVTEGFENTENEES